MSFPLLHVTFTVVLFVVIKTSYLISAVPHRNKNCLNCHLALVPAKRNPNGGVESLRAIPWILLDAKPLNATSMAGCGCGNSKIVDEGKGHIIEEMCKAWPFFSTRVGMLEMVFSKTDTLAF